MKDDLDAVRAATSKEITQGLNVIIVAHSYGGIVANSAIKGFSTPHNKASNNSPPGTSSGLVSRASYVIGLVLVASGSTLIGLSFMDLPFCIPRPMWRVNKKAVFADIVTPSRQLFYHDFPEDEAETWVSQFTN